MIPIVRIIVCVTQDSAIHPGVDHEIFPLLVGGQSCEMLLDRLLILESVDIDTALALPYEFALGNVFFRKEAQAKLRLSESVLDLKASFGVSVICGLAVSCITIFDFKVAHVGAKLLAYPQ